MAGEYNHANFLQLQNDVVELRSAVAGIKAEVKQESSTRFGAEVAEIRAKVDEATEDRLKASTDQLNKYVE